MEGQSQDVGQTVLNTKKDDDQVGSAEYFVCLFSNPAEEVKPHFFTTSI